MELSSTNKKIVASGTLLTFDDEDTTITFAIGDRSYSFILHFEDDPTNNRSVNFEQITDYSLKFSFHNFNDVLGVGNTQAMSLGNANNKQLSANFIVRRLNQSTKIREVIYTYYLDK